MIFSCFFPSAATMAANKCSFNVLQQEEMYILLTLPISRVIFEWLTKGWWFGVNLPYSMHQTKPGSRAGKAFHYLVQLRAGNTAPLFGKRDFPVKNINQFILHTEGDNKVWTQIPNGSHPWGWNNQQYSCSEDSSMYIMNAGSTTLLRWKLLPEFVCSAGFGD